jgi:enamine deaminase RidA (YjgF/YER057c/UK114 family)
MSDRDLKLEQLGYSIERTTPEGSLVDDLIVDGNTIYASGQVPFDGETLTSRGKVPSQVSIEQATEAAALCTQTCSVPCESISARWTDFALCE